ncbi:ABC transporter ATP-binding protein [Isoptericola sp. AK164]|uniref:ABC transporter ATP-binding protein n=1 Tax=Isoptericola sp. AK164 TaxID=3024246 RepID=UPI0024187E18|nr:ABC transporter ATP-binding protein [Isoptericola sp. AK164]
MAREIGFRAGRTTILRGVSLSVASGRSVAIQGRSGSGKSTLLTLLMGLVRPTAGSVHLGSVGLSGLSRARRADLRAQHVGVVFQDAELLDELTAEENVALPALLQKRDRAVARSRARHLLAELDVPHDRSSAVLSGGERQRVGVARALINDPQVILADEPTGALDAELRDAAASLLFDLPARTGCALLVVTHDPSVASRADERYVMDAGELRSWRAAAVRS